MGSECCKSKKHDVLDDDDSLQENNENFSKERLHMSQGQTQIDVKVGHLHESDAQCLVTVINNRGIPDSCDLLKHIKDSLTHYMEQDHLRKYEEKHNYGSILTVPLPQNRHLVFLVLPIWKGGRHEELKYLDTSIIHLIDYIKQNQISSVSMEEVGVKQFGYPRQDVVKLLVNSFDGFLKSNPASGLQRLCFMSHEMVTVASFEQEIKKQMNNELGVDRKKTSFSVTREVVEPSANQRTQSKKDELEQPLLSS